MGRRRGRDRDTTDIASPVPRLAPAPTVWPSGLLQAIEDRRLYHPEGPWAQPKGLFRTASEVVGTPARSPRSVGGQRSGLSPDYFKFRSPKAVVKCVRRKQRREVLFATGKGGRGWRKKRRDQWSDVHCR